MGASPDCGLSMGFLEKSVNFWLAVIGAALYVYASHKDMPFFPRMLKVVSASLIGVSTHEEISASIGAVSFNATLVAIIVLSWVIIDATVTLIMNHKDLIALIRKVTGR